MRFPGARLVIMNGIGHFPMVENYPLFRSTCCLSSNSCGIVVVTARD